MRFIHSKPYVDGTQFLLSDKETEEGCTLVEACDDAEGAAMHLAELLQRDPNALAGSKDYNTATQAILRYQRRLKEILALSDKVFVILEEETEAKGKTKKREAIITTVEGDEEEIVASLKKIAPKIAFSVEGHGGTVWIIATYEGRFREHVPVKHWPGQRNNPGTLEHYDEEVQ